MKCRIEEIRKARNNNKMKRLILLLSLATVLFASDIQDIDNQLGRFEHRNGTLIDHFAKVQWQDNKDSKTIRKHPQGAKDYCANLILDGKNDWQLPNRYELKYAYEIKDSFNNVKSAVYWSSTPYAGYTPGAWVVYFGDGDEYGLGKSNYIWVRCIRPADNFDTLKQEVQKNRDIATHNYKLAFNKAKKLNTIESYLNFVLKYPKAPQVKNI